MAAHHPSLTAARPARQASNALAPSALFPSAWDACIFALVIGALVLIAFGGRQTLQPLAHNPAISLDPRVLPDYALRTTMRMLAAIVCSTAFTFAYGALAVKSRRAEMVLIPLLDILQSIPVLGFMPFTITFFLTCFPGGCSGRSWRRSSRSSPPRPGT